MFIASETLQNARIDWVLAEIEKMGMKYPVKEVSEKTEYSKGIVSNYLNKKAIMSLEFVKKFCDAFEYNFDAVNGLLIERIEQQIKDNQQGKKDIQSGTTYEYDFTVVLDDKTITTMDNVEFIKMMAHRVMTAHENLISKIDSVKLKEESIPKKERHG